MVVDSTKTPQADLVALLQEKAADIGANAIIIHPGTSTTIGNVPAGMVNEKTEHHFMATAIRIKFDWRWLSPATPQP